MSIKYPRRLNATDCESFYEYRVAGRAVRDFSAQARPDDVAAATGATSAAAIFAGLPPLPAAAPRALLLAVALASLVALGGGGGEGGGGSARMRSAAPPALAFFAPSGGVGGGGESRESAAAASAAALARASGCTGGAPRNAAAAAAAAPELDALFAACFAPPKEWALARVAPGQQDADGAIAVYASVLVGEACAPLFSPHLKCPAGGRGGAFGGASGGAPAGAPLDNSSVVLATHASPDRFASVLKSAARWGGCVSVAVPLCAARDFAAVLAAWGADPAARARVTVHVLLGEAGPYPFNTARNAALEPLLPGRHAHDAARVALAPWALVVDADALASGSEPVFRAAAERLAAPPAPWRAEWAADAAAAACAGGAGDAPLPHPCAEPKADGLAWAALPATAAAARARSRCAHAFDAEATLFAVASFDVEAKREDAELVAQTVLSAGPPGGAPARLHAALARAVRTNAVTLQAAAFKDAYFGMMHWSAWLEGGVGPMAINYALSYEPYFMMKAHRDARLFDEFYRGAGWDKSSFFLAHASAAAARPLALVMLPDVFLLNARNPAPEAPPPGSALARGKPVRENRPGNSAAYWGYCKEHGMVCPTRCTPALPPPGGSAGVPGAGGGGDAAADYRAARDALRAAMAADPPNTRRGETPPVCAAVEDGVDYVQDGSPLFKAQSVDECCAACEREPLCRVWTWRGPASLILKPGEWRNCWLKHVVSGRKEDATTRELCSGVVQR